ncbi:GNAT family acetyltransferase, partial [Stipitochalara longipes BDJ]
MPLSHLFSSDRLIYRALENTSESRDHFRNVVLKDSETFGQASFNKLLKPLTSNDLEKTFSGAADVFLAVVIHLQNEDRKEPTPGTPPVGWLSLDSPPASRHHRSCTMGITISTDYQRKGYGTEAITWAVNWAFRVAGMHAVRLGVFSFNERAVRLYERLGFVREGVNRDAYYYDYKWHDRILFSILEKEWVTIHKSKSKS